MRIILQSLLVIAVAFAYVAGPYLTVEMEHVHEVCGNHGHQHTGGDHEHHPHDHDTTPSSDIPAEGNTEGDPHSHTHDVSLGMDVPFTPASQHSFIAKRMGAYHPAAISEFVPDGPCFPLIKPPQLG